MIKKNGHRHMHHIVLWTCIGSSLFLTFLTRCITYPDKPPVLNRRRLADKDECLFLMQNYNVAPGRSWGNLSPSKQDRWKSMNCDELIPADLVKDENGLTYEDRMNKCKSINEKKGASSLEKLPTHVKQFWKKLNCSKLLNGSKVPSNQIANCLDSDEENKEKIALVFAVTTRGVGVGAGDGFTRNLAAFDILLPSFTTTAECGFDYLIVMAYDKGDNFYDSQEGQSKVKNWFKSNLQTPFKEHGLEVDLILAETDNQVKKPGPAFTAGTKAAYKAGADWFFRVNDDTELLDPWATKFTRKLKAEGLPYGVVGPKCYKCNSRILVHDFTHRTHMDIFKGNYYPPQLSDWWMDDWISRVYGSQRTFMALSVKAAHHTGKHGQRYKVDQSHKNFLSGLIKEGHNRIGAYMTDKNVDPGLISKFLSDRTNGAPFKDIS